MTRILLMICLAAGATAGEIVGLYDAFGKPTAGTEFGWGYSALIRFGDKTILFDAGSDADRFAKNVAALKVDLKKVDFAVLSHSHGDHLSGFDYVFKANPTLKLYVPQDRLFGVDLGLALPRVPEEIAQALPQELRYFGGESRAYSGPWGTRFWHARTEAVAETKEIAPGVFLIATESKVMGNFSRVHADDPPSLSGLPELSLALVTPQGVVLVTGCSHSGIEHILRQTMNKVPGEVQLVTGGFHLLQNREDELERLAQTMKQELRVRRVAPAHCTGMQAFAVFRKVYGADFVAAGLGSRVGFQQ